jgi:hypothetical protein
MQRLVTHQNPEGKETPLLLLDSLRQIDPKVELCYAGNGRWWLGSVSDNTERHARATHMMKQIEALERWQQSARTVMLCKLNLQGFALIETYHGHDPHGLMTVNPGSEEYQTTILEDFAWRDSEWRRDQGSANVKQRLLETLGEPERIEQEALMKEYLANDGRDQYRRIMKGRFQFGHGGMTGGSNALILPG